MSTETETETEPETVGLFTRIGYRLWAGYEVGDNFVIRTGENPAPINKTIIVERVAVSNLLRVLTRRRPQYLEGLDEKLESHRQSIRAIVDRLAALEVLVGGPNEVDVLRSQIGTLASMVEGLTDIVERQQQKPAESQPIASDYATKDFVDQAIRRLNGALREHIRRTFEQALRAAAPGPGTLRRVWDALNPAAPVVEPNRRYEVSTFTPERAVALGVDAARQAVGE